AHRHRQLLFRLLEVPAHHRVAPAGGPARRLPPHHRLLPRQPAALPGGGMIPFLQLRPADDANDVQAAIARVVERGWFVLGPELEAFEKAFAHACAAAFAVGVGTGTDALSLALRAIGIGPGDEVITSPLSAAYSALAIMAAGARPVFADIDPLRFTIDPSAIE